MNRFLLAAATALALGFSLPAMAATMHEGDVAGGSFSKSFAAPTVLGAGVTGVTGTGAQGAHDFFVFKLPAGAQTLTFAFAAPEGIRPSYSAGGTIMTSTAPFRWGWDGTRAGAFQLDRRTPAVTQRLTLDAGFAGTLHVALYFTHGRDIAYSVRSDANRAAPPPVAPPVSVVPLPGAGALMLTALGMAGIAARRRRA
jgi:hypothetical protein